MTRTPTMTTDDYERNLAAVAAALPTDVVAVGFGWWAAAGDEVEEIAESHGLDFTRVAYAAAAISPGLRWNATMEILLVLIKSHLDGEASYPRGVGHMTFGYRGRDRAWEVLTTEVDPATICRGPKVGAVALNLLGDLSAVAVDRHLVRAATNGRLDQASPVSMARIAEATARAAKTRRLMPAQLQAAIWVAAQ